MASKKRAPVQDKEQRKDLHQQLESGQDSELGVSNAAAQRQLAPVRADAEDQQLVRETALPTVEQALLAVQISPRSGEMTEKLMETLERSRLTEERRLSLMQRLQEDQSMADLVGRTLEASFGVDSPELRAELWRTLDHSWGALVANENSGGWTSEIEAALGAERSEGALAERALTMIGDLSAYFSDNTMAAESPSGDVSASVQQFCRSIALLSFWEEEEEEEELGLLTPEFD